MNDMADSSKLRMNLAAVKKVDPYATDIVDSSSHVAFYTFNSDKNEWEKTDVEGAFFLYSRSAKPHHSIFINNRLNTMSFMEPITSHMELQSKPPFLLYRNERARIRGFWFYEGDECVRISILVAKIVQKIRDEHPQHLQPLEQAGEAPAAESHQMQHENTFDIFKMLSKAQQDYNDSQQHLRQAPQAPQPLQPQQQEAVTDNNVLKFFAAAKPTVNEANLLQRMLPNTLSVEQLEKQQRGKSPLDAATPKKQKPAMSGIQQLNAAMAKCELSHKSNNNNNNNHEQLQENAKKKSSKAACDLKKSFLQSFSNDASLLLPNVGAVLNNSLHLTPSKPALMLPTMFEKSSEPASNNCFVKIKTDQQQLTLNPTQLVQAFTYMLQNDEDFVLKLHEAYIKTVSKTLLENYQ